VTCRAARRLLPLFAGGDLKAAKASAVADHLAACAACRAEEDAFAAARSLLPFSSLSFGESERALIRRRVLDEIARRGSPSFTVALLLRPRFALAALAGVVVLAASLVSPFFVRNDVEPAAALRARPVPAATPAPPEEHMAEAASPLVPHRSTASSRAVRADGAPRSTVPASEKSGPAVRFEIQTGNVNVRIIWFTRGDSAGEEPSGPTSDPNDVS
jgi:putative zinc finger protein